MGWSSLGTVETEALDGQLGTADVSLSVPEGLLVSAAGLEPATHALKEYPASVAGESNTRQHLRDVPHFVRHMYGLRSRCPTLHIWATF